VLLETKHRIWTPNSVVINLILSFTVLFYKRYLCCVILYYIILFKFEIPDYEEQYDNEFCTTR
jgi:hypothetical protein